MWSPITTPDERLVLDILLIKQAGAHAYLFDFPFMAAILRMRTRDAYIERRAAAVQSAGQHVSRPQIGARDKTSNLLRLGLGLELGIRSPPASATGTWSGLGPGAANARLRVTNEAE